MAFYVLMEPFSIKATIWSTPILCGTNINYVKLDEILSKVAFVFSFICVFIKQFRRHSWFDTIGKLKKILWKEMMHKIKEKIIIKKNLHQKIFLVYIFIKTLGDIHALKEKMHKIKQKSKILPQKIFHPPVVHARQCSGLLWRPILISGQ